MSTPHLSVLPGGPVAPASTPGPDGTARLHLSGPVQVHVHFGPAAPASPAPSDARPATPQRRPLVPLALLGLALAGGGYWAGSRPAAPVGADAAAAAGALAADPITALALPPGLPAVPGVPGEVPPALRQQLARPSVVTPPPGAPPAAKTAPAAGPTAGAGSAPAAPGRNPFGLGD